MELIKWNSQYTLKASSPLLQKPGPNLVFNTKSKGNANRPNTQLFSSRLCCRENRDQLVNQFKAGGKAMWVLIAGAILCCGNPVYIDSAFGQGLNVGYTSEIVDKCKEEKIAKNVEKIAKNVEGAEEVDITNEEIVEEAWRVVNENFLDARHHKWSPESWLKKKEEALRRPIQTRSAAHDIIRRMLVTLDDPYTHFLAPSEFTKLARFDLTGIGISLKEVSDEDGITRLKVLGIILGGPAYSAGIRQGDEILSVNGTSVQGMTSFEAASLIQGPKETFVSMEVKQGNCGGTQSVAVERQQTVRTPVFYRLEKAENANEYTGYIRLKEFNALARKDLMIAMRRLKDAGASSFVLDLRDNPGGLAQAGIEISKLFLESGETVMYTTGREIDSEKSILAENSPLTTAPLMVLVNGRTASASEIVAAALHDNCRAILVGERTYGKGLIQSVYELKDGSGMVVTVGKYVTPSHKDIDGNGIEPDFRRRP
ncbi:hypothetical protein KI387_023379, partial [Taxus chinensis]